MAHYHDTPDCEGCGRSPWRCSCPPPHQPPKRNAKYGKAGFVLGVMNNPAEKPAECGTCGGSGKAPSICPYHLKPSSECGCVKRPVHSSAKDPCPDCEVTE